MIEGEKSVAKQRSCTYHGTIPGGHHHIKENGKDVLVCGTAHEQKLCAKRTDGGPKLWIGKLRSTTPGYKASTSRDQRLIAYCPNTGTRFRIVGQVKHLVESSASGSVNSHSEKTKCKSGDGANTLSRNSANESQKASDKQSKHAFAREYEAIAIQRSAGLDPDVRLWFITAYLGESRANLYRKMGVSFPKPIKRGKSSFWPMSLIEAYKAGTYEGAQ
jgi:predicted DNA-binding transcriptional regulator AlpA